jgi:hypothetical protein
MNPKPKYAVEVRPYKNSPWVQRGRLFYTKEEADLALYEFTDKSPTGPWYEARVREAKAIEIQEWERH